jgi:alpha-mannosidase
MGHVDGLDHDSLAREVLGGASAWQSGDRSGAVNRLRAGFELLTQARERFYPVDAYLIDLCLVDPATPAGGLADTFAARTPVTLIAPAQAIDAVAGRDPEAVASLRAAVSEGWADVVGGSFAESDESLLPFESIVWQYRQGSEVYRRHLDDRNVETIARRRFALYPALPQLARRFGFRFALHLGFDAGRFPIRPESKRLWESPDGSSLETLMRPPLAADRDGPCVSLPWRLAQTMKDDHVATLPLVHWPDRVADWYRDLRRVATYSPVLARWVTLNDYFHLTDRPFEAFRPEADQYVTPYLAQAAARGDTHPISRRAEHSRLRARLDGISACRALAKAVAPTSADPTTGAPTDEELEQALETGKADEITSALSEREASWGAALSRGIAGTTTGGRPGYLVLNPLGIARRVAVLLPEAALDLRPEGPLRASQFTDEGVWAVVDLPPFGYAWVPREPNLEVPPSPTGLVSVRDRVLRNESMAVEIDKTTGGIRGVRGPSEETARLGQQLVLTGIEGADGTAITTRMRCESFEVDYAGPALVQAFARGVVLDPRDDRRLASFHQRYRLWSGRPVLEVEIGIADLAANWVERASRADPWAHYLACRWAWPDPNSMLRRTCVLSPELTEAERPETPDAFDISTRRQRTALLFGGLAHHQRHGPRMLDTILVAGREVERAFRLGVVLDLEHPFHAAFDFVSPAYVVATESGPPRTGPSGWLFQLDSKAVAITRLGYIETSGEGRGWGVALHLVETSGQAARCRLRSFLNPTWACQTDFHKELVLDLPLDGDAVLIDLTPHEMARVEITLG